MIESILVRLKILSETRTAEDLSLLIGLECNQSWKKGDLIPKTTMLRKQHAWILTAKCQKLEALETQISTLMEQLVAHSDQIYSLSKTEEVELSCVIYADHTPALNLRPNLLAAISNLGATLDIDVILTDEQEA